MELEEPLWRESRLLRRLQEQSEGGEGNGRRGRLSQPKGRTNLIKINKGKLPLDFFPKRTHSNARRPPSLRFNLPPDIQEIAHLHKKAESQRMHNSPEKTSFFGYFDEEPASAGRLGGRVYNRKFETRDEPKRDAFPVESARKLTTATKQCKNEFLELFPSTHDEMTTQIIISSNKVRNFKLSPRKEYISKTRDLQAIIDPEKQLSARKEGEFELKQRQVECSSKQSNLHNQAESLNITFFNAKSSCFPPINRPAHA